MIKREKLISLAEMNCKEIEAMLKAVSSGNADIMSALIIISNDIRIMIQYYDDSIQNGLDLHRFEQSIKELSEELGPLCNVIEELINNKDLTAEDKERIDEIGKRLINSLESIKSV